MKKFITCITLIALIFVAGSCGLTKDVSVNATVLEKTETVLAVKVNEASEEAKFINAMYKLKTLGEIDYEISGTYIVSINGVAGASDFSSYWALFTSDMENAFYDPEQSWSYYEYNGEILGYSNYGATDLSLKAGATYVWVYTVYSY